MPPPVDASVLSGRTLSDASEKSPIYYEKSLCVANKAHFMLQIEPYILQKQPLRCGARRDASNKTVAYTNRIERYGFDCQRALNI